MSAAAALSVEIRLLREGEMLPDLPCGDDDLTAFLRDDAARLHGQGVVTVYVAFLGQALVGYVALLTDSISVSSAERKKMHLRHDDHPAIPAVKIGRLAVHADHQGKGIGTALIRFAVDKALLISESVGCRLLTLDAYPQKVDWYERLGFVRNRRVAKESAVEWQCPIGCPEHQDHHDGDRVSMRLDFGGDTLPDKLR